MATAPYGSWRSPITTQLLVEDAVTLSQPRVSGDDVYWLEGRPAEGGRVVIVRNGEDVLPAPWSARTRVHEYGGGSYAVHGQTVFFSNWSDQRLYRVDPGGEPVAITLDNGDRHADHCVSPDGRAVISIRERHGDEVVNEVVVLPADGSAEPGVLVSGRDFYSTPRLSPDARRLLWLEWDHPNMPWDGCRLFVADLTDEYGIRNAQWVTGGDEESVFQPSFGPDGRVYWVSDATGWWNLYRDGENPAPRDAEFGTAQWVFGMSTYGVLVDGRVVCAFSDRGRGRLGVIDDDGLHELDLPWTTCESPQVLGHDGVVFIGASATREPAVVALDLGTLEGPDLARTRPKSMDPGYLSEPEAIEFPTEGGLTAHALFYPPANRDHDGPDGERPPLLVYSHGGPTGSAPSFLNLNKQFWTSRGFAIVDVNYGGSTGYGRAYRQRLRGQWGIVDVDDCINAARFLAARGDVDPARMAIRGGSAGGYTTLCALVFHDVFAAGASHYGVADAETLARDTHKFESRYLDGLIGPYPEAADLYRQRSPIHFTDRLSCPLILFQGLEDEVVPPAQAEQMVAALRDKGIPFAYVPFEGEQHGFRKAESIKRSLEAELYFYGKVFGFTPADEIAPVEIENLS